MSRNFFSNQTRFNLKIPYDELSDPRTENWLLVKSFSNVAVLVALYLLIVWHLPKWMARRKAYDLRVMLIIYNLSMALLNARVCGNAILGAWHSNYSILCQPCQVIYTQNEMQIAMAVWLFYISKCLEFADTIFFILRKKSKQLTFLHVFHHSTMFPIQWLAIKWVPTGSTFLPAAINSFVHVLMYSYYGLSALGPSMQKHLWWKRYLTVLQLTQFSICWVWALQALATNCDFPRWISYATISYMTLFLVLFGNFYIQSYGTKRHVISHCQMENSRDKEKPQ